MANYKISGTTNKNGRSHVIKNGSYVGYKDTTSGLYNLVFEADDANDVMVSSEVSDGETVGFGGVEAIATGDSVNIVLPESDAGLPKTGQTTSYATGDDGDLEVGKVRSYTDNADGTITDNTTGLMWAKDGNDAGCNNGNLINWASSISYANGLTFAGYDDWRIPNIIELISIVDYGETLPSIDITYFTNTAVPGTYWTSNTNSGNTTQAYGVSFLYGGPSAIGKGTGIEIRCVRGGV